MPNDLFIENKNNMKKTLLFFLFISSSVSLLCQGNLISLSGGYAFSSYADIETNAKGWRVNGSYEFNRMGSNIANGIVIGFVSLHAEDDDGSNYDISTVPFYYAPRFFFGSGKIKGFIKGALGMQRSWLNRSGPVGDWEDKDFGFAGGAGLGANYFINEKFFLNAEYELLWCSNSYYRDGLLNTASLGIGVRF
jgi:hypothetical protein